MSKPVHILMVEDSPTDAGLTIEAFRESKVANNLVHVEDGTEALAYLRRQGNNSDAPRPDLILLDLNLPTIDGREVLAQIKADPALRNIPVAVLTTSDDEEDIVRSYDLHANCYITKPLEFERFATIVEDLQNFWFSVVTLPRSGK